MVLACHRHLRLRRLGLLPVGRLSGGWRAPPRRPRWKQAHEARGGGGRALRQGRSAAADRRCAAGERQGPGSVRPPTIWLVSTSSTRAGARRRVELAGLAAAGVDTELLDIGSGMGGPARFLAATRGCRVVGVDLTPEYVPSRTSCRAAAGSPTAPAFLTAECFEPAVRGRQLRRRLHPARGHEHRRQGQGLYADAARVLRPGAVLVIYDILRGPGGAVQLPDAMVGGRYDQFPGRPPGAPASCWTRPASRSWSIASGGKTPLPGSRPGPPCRRPHWPLLSVRLLLGPAVRGGFRQPGSLNLRSADVCPTLVRAVRR